MPKKNRLSHAEHSALKTARRLHGQFFSLSVSPLAGGPSKFTCVVSKKVFLEAHDRNLLKRRCREAVRPQFQKFQQPSVFVFVAKKAAAHASFIAIRQDMDTLLQSLQ